MELVKGKIYKIVADDTTNIYIGSTIKRLLCERFKCHKNSHNNTGSKILFTYPNTRIELIERYECESINKLREREQYHIEINKDTITKKHKIYVENNKEKEKKKKKEWGDKIVICDCGASVSRQCLSKHKKRNIHIELLNNKHKI